MLGVLSVVCVVRPSGGGGSAGQRQPRLDSAAATQLLEVLDAFRQRSAARLWQEDGERGSDEQEGGEDREGDASVEHEQLGREHDRHARERTRETERLRAHDGRVQLAGEQGDHVVRAGHKQLAGDREHHLQPLYSMHSMHSYHLSINPSINGVQMLIFFLIQVVSDSWFGI